MKRVEETVVIIEGYHCYQLRKKLSNILVSKLNSYVEEIVVSHQCAFYRYRSTTDKIFCIRLILEIRRKCDGIIHQLLIDFETAYVLIRRDVFYSMLI